jgi:hypothetical protein
MHSSRLQRGFAPSTLPFDQPNKRRVFRALDNGNAEFTQDRKQVYNRPIPRQTDITPHLLHLKVFAETSGVLTTNEKEYARRESNSTCKILKESRFLKPAAQNPAHFLPISFPSTPA